jgi:hypothetical protein
MYVKTGSAGEKQQADAHNNSASKAAILAITIITLGTSFDRRHSNCRQLAVGWRQINNCKPKSVFAGPAGGLISFVEKLRDPEASAFFLWKQPER